MKALLLLVAVLAAGIAVAARAVRQQATFRTSVDLVTVDVLVVSSNGRPMAGLRAADFDVYDNGIRQQIDDVAEGALQPGAATLKAQPLPLDVMFVFDTSESMAGERIQNLAQAARGVLDRLRPVDAAAVISFSDRTVLQAPLSGNLRGVGRSLQEMEADGRTSVFDALYAALTLKRSTGRRSMVLLFTDGRDNASWLDAKDVLQVVRESDSVIYGVGMDSGVSAEVKELTEMTGGDLIVAQSARQLKDLFARVIGEMQARYVLTYYPKGVNRSGWHAIEVRLTSRKAEVKARRGYYVPG